MGSAATGIPIGAPVLLLPLKLQLFPYAWSSRMMPEVEMNDGGIVGKLQVKLMVPFPPLFLFFFSKLKNIFLCFFLERKIIIMIMMLGV